MHQDNYLFAHQNINLKTSLFLAGLLDWLLALLRNCGSSLSVGICWRLLTGLLGSCGSFSSSLLYRRQLCVLLEHGSVRIQLKQSADILQWVGLKHCSSDLSVGCPQDLTDLLRLEKLGKISDCHLRHGQVPVLLGLRRLSPCSVDRIQLLECALSPDAETANVATGGELQQVQLLDVDGVHSRDVTEGTSQTLTKRNTD